MSSKQRRLVLVGALLVSALVVGALLVAALSAWAGRRDEPTAAPPRDLPGAVPHELPAPAAERRPSQSEAARREVTTLYEHETSAYRARLFADVNGAVLLTEAGIVTFRDGKAPEERAITLGPVAALQGGSVVFWRSGRLREVSLSGGDERELVAMPRPPQHLLASEGQVAWTQAARAAGTSLQTVSDGQVRVAYESEDTVTAAIMRGTAVYWVLRSRDRSWRLGRVELDGRQTLTRPRSGRPPSMLALGPDGVYFYEGPEQGVRKFTFDLEREDAVAAHVICSPLAVSSRVVCAHVGGLFDIPGPGMPPRFLASERAAPVATLAATEDRVFWVAESGEHLVVRSEPLAGL